MNQAVKYVKDYVKEVKDDKIQGFLRTEPTLPKVLYFTDKPRKSLLIKALSSSFNHKLSFGQINKTETEILDLFDVEEFPKLILIKNGVKKPFVFKGEFKFKDLFEFLNVFSEQFVPKSTGATEEDKPWLFQAIPEMHGKSSKDVCLGQAKTLCIITFSPEPLSKDKIDDLKKLKKEFDNKRSRLNFKFVWMNSSLHKEWVDKLEIEDPTKLNVRILRTGRRTKFIKMASEFSVSNVENMIEKVLGGDARSIPLRSGVPAFTEEL